jgi:branched-chain amino acid transport system ATP-binding protein
MILLDEPSEGLAPKIIEQMADAINEMKRQGLSILLSEQNLHFARLISDRAYIIEKGRVRFTGTIAELDANDEIRRAYLAV